MSRKAKKLAKVLTLPCRCGEKGLSQCLRQEPHINAILPTHARAAPRALQRARGDVRLSAKPRDGRSVLADLRQSGSLKVLFPRTNGADLQAVLINTAGGITGGDMFTVSARADADTTLTLTTQAAERAYGALAGQIGQLDTHLTAAQNARIKWLPQETIFFDRCALRRTMQIDLADSARLLFAEPLVFGRATMGETLNHCLFHDRVEVRRKGVPLFTDATRLEGHITRRLARPAVGGGAGAMVSVLYIAPDAAAHLEPLRDMLPDTGGASLLHSDVLVLRALASDSHALRCALMPILTRLSGDDLPRPWMI